MYTYPHFGIDKHVQTICRLLIKLSTSFFSYGFLTSVEDIQHPEAYTR